MKTRLPGLLAAFLLGAVLAALWLMRDDTEQLPKGGAGAKLSSTPAGAATSGETPRLTTKGASDLPEQISSLTGASNELLPGLGGEIQRKLVDILQAPEEERIGRLGILMADLRAGGNHSVVALRDYLRSGQDLKISQIIIQELRPWGGRETFRNCLLSVLFEITAKDPALAVESGREILATTKSVSEISLVSEGVEKTGAGALTPATEEAVHRALATAKGLDFQSALSLTAKLHSEALLREVTAAVEKQPWAPDVSEMLTASWKFPDAVRLEISQQLLANDRVKESFKGNPRFLVSLDARLPEFRRATVEAFQDATAPEQRVHFLRDLASSEPPPAIRRGAPGSQDQAIARLQLLDELEPACDSVLLQQYLAEARAHLKKLASKP